MLQDDFYLKIEANAFFDRWKIAQGKKYDGKLRENKQSILSQMEKNISLKNLKVLEVGCFIGDLLGHLKKKYSCDVYGIEPSSKACDLAKKKFNLKIENSTFIKSNFFSLNIKKKNTFDLIILDDVLSWMSRQHIMQVLAIIDWLLKIDGAIFFRDFSPSFSFAYENHHQKNNDIYNFKQSYGHRNFFLQTGMYYEKFTKISNLDNLQKIKTFRKDAGLWADSILIKTSKPMHPVLKL
jgi:ubiquinone/menaquinone biosynthesis C-methylase UbiE